MPELGYQTDGLRTWGSLVGETHETNPDLMWPLSIDVFDRMRSEDSQVGSVLRAVTQPILSTEWVLDPAGVDPEVVDLVAEDLGLPVKGREQLAPLRTKGRFSWAEHIRLALLSLVFGHSFFEQIYRPEGDKLRLAKLAWRPPRTISDVKVAADGGLVAIVQHGTGTKRDVTIPVDRLVAYVNEREGANWLGRSLLRTCYKNWLLKDRLLRIQALTAERNGLGIPTYTGTPAPDNANVEDKQKWQQSEIDHGLQIAKDARAGETSGISIPHGASFDFKGVTGKLPDTDGPIRYHDEQIARAVLAHFLNLGTETGSWALGSTFADFFTNSLNGVAQYIASVTQQHVIEDLVDRNWGPTTRAPQLVPAKIGAQHPATAEAIRTLIDAGALTADPALEAHVRAQYGLPAREETADTGTEHAAADIARAVAELIQKVYLGVGTVVTKSEARDLVRQAGGQLEADDALEEQAEEAA